MKAVAYTKSGPINQEHLFVDIDLPIPTPNTHDLLVEVKAISINPVDTKIRRAVTPAPEGRILGWDAAGIVKSVGANVTLFKPGDHVYYAGELNRSGSNAEYQLVDERIVGHMPRSLSFAEAAAIPLTALTAYEALFDRIGLNQDSKRLLIIGAAGGVGSLATQLARLTKGVDVIGTASRPESMAWVKKMGAHHVINHTQPFQPQFDALNISAPDVIFSTTHTDDYLPQIVDILAPQGKLVLIDDPDTFDIRPLKTKSISVHWELMFTRSMYQTSDMIRQHHILTEVAQLIDDKKIMSTISETLRPINAKTIQLAHEKIEAGRTIGKLVLEW